MSGLFYRASVCCRYCGAELRIILWPTPFRERANATVRIHYLHHMIAQHGWTPPT